MALPQGVPDFVGGDPELVEVILDFPAPVTRALGAEGVETCVDFVGLWGTAEAFLQFFQAHLGYVPDAELRMDAARGWSRIAARARQQKASAVTVVSAQRLSVYPCAPAEPTPASSRDTAVVRRLVTAGGAVQDGPALTSVPVPQEPWSREEAAKQVKLDQLFNLLLQYVVDVSEIGIPAHDLADPVARRGVRDTLLHAASRLSGARIGALVSSFKRWVRFCNDHGWDPRQPTPYQVATFLQSVTRGGPTAAASMHAALKWFEASAGAAFPMAHHLVAPFRFHAASHTSRQAPELEPWEFVNLLLAWERARGTHKVILGIILMAAVSCIRWEHLQRSTYLASHAGWLEFQCSQGKRRRQGARPAYQWSLPEVKWRGQSLVALLRDFYKHEMVADAGFLVPALSLSPEDLWEVTETTALITNKAMSRGRFLELFRGALMGLGLGPSSASGATFNRLRRFMPTLANATQISDQDMQAVGSWVEVVQGGGDPGRQRAAIAMGQHYAGNKALRSAQVKTRLIARFFALWRLHQPQAALTADGFLPVDSWLWPAFAEAHQTVPWDTGDAIPEEVSDIEEGEVTVVEVAPGALPEAVSQDRRESSSSSEPEPLSSRDDSSSSASDVSADGDDMVGILADLSAADAMPWFKQGAKVHVTREVTEEDLLVPFCRDRPFHQEPVLRGTGFVQGSADGVCARCLARMPRGLYLALAEHNGWSH